MKQFRATNNGRQKRGSIIMEQYIPLIIIFYAFINDEDSERRRVSVSHRPIKHLYDTNRSILKIQNIFSSIRYRGLYNFGNPCIINV